MILDKIKVTPEKILIEYHTDSPSGPNIYTMECHDRARPELYKLFEDMRDHVCEILELPVGWVDGIIVRGISFSEHNDVQGAVITSIKTLKESTSPFIFNTPYKTFNPVGKNPDRKYCLSIDCVKILAGIQAEAELYMKGRRSQLEIFTSDKDPTRERAKRDGNAVRRNAAEAE